ncbi:hypothetical protein ACFFJ7_13055 [Pseudochelatococcus lubricantis]|uniref:hypothetical protein n=1 Tax=Pseudochelatococcus lubricantis TaxID=1538102 RepID=UPI0035EF0500
MRPVIIGLILLGIVFLVAMGAGAALVPTGNGSADWKDRMNSEGAPWPFEVLGTLFSPLAPGATPVAATGNQCGGGALFVGKSTQKNRVARARLTAGNGARISLSGLDPRADGKPMPMVLCLRRADAAVPTSGCENQRLTDEATFAIGPGGGCFTVEALGGGTPRVTWN